MVHGTEVGISGKCFILKRGGRFHDSGESALSVTLNLTPEVERGLTAQAREHGVSLNEYLQEIVTRAARLSTALPLPKAKNLSDLLLNSPFAGANLNLERSRDYPRSVEIE